MTPTPETTQRFEHRSHAPALATGFAAFAATAGLATFATMSEVSWFTAFVWLWSIASAAMAALQPAPMPTKEQVAAGRDEEKLQWPAIRPRMLAILAPWWIGLGVYVGMRASRHGWGDGGIRSMDEGHTYDAPTDMLFLLIALSPFASFLLTGAVTLPAVYAVAHTGAERLWGWARASLGAGLSCLMTVAMVTVPKNGYNTDERGGIDPLEFAASIPRVLIGDTGRSPGWITPLLYVAIVFLGVALAFFLRSDKHEHDESTNGRGEDTHVA